MRAFIKALIEYVTTMETPLLPHQRKCDSHFKRIVIGVFLVIIFIMYLSFVIYAGIETHHDKNRITVWNLVTDSVMLGWLISIMLAYFNPKNTSHWRREYIHKSAPTVCMFSFFCSLFFICWWVYGIGLLHNSQESFLILNFCLIIPVAIVNILYAILIGYDNNVAIQEEKQYMTRYNNYTFNAGFVSIFNENNHSLPPV